VAAGHAAWLRSQSYAAGRRDGADPATLKRHTLIEIPFAFPVAASGPPAGDV